MTRPARILIVDDTAYNRDLLVEELEDLGHDTVVAVDGVEALAMVAKAPPDLILLDLMMPRLDGFGVLSALRERPDAGEIPVIVVSAHHEIDRVVRGIELGAVDHLTKPIEPAVLAARVNAWLERGRARERERAYVAEIERQRARGDALLEAILPPEAVRELATTGRVLPRAHTGVAVMFLDVAGFSRFTTATAPKKVVELVTMMSDAAERAAHAAGIEKLKMVGDAAVVAGNLLQPHEAPVAACVACARQLMAEPWLAEHGLNLRGGLTLGPVISGITGRSRMAFDIWGQAVNTAAHLSGLPGGDVIYIDEPAAAALASPHAEPIGPMTLKGVDQIEVYKLVCAGPPGRGGSRPSR
ncbi:response regulator [Acuticoccus sp. I52.16.1]|uniref:response regulator n=1 Tax=Acuticoccus sp. I52.16.1 TaxID=2928472 RepID=UPI001FD4D8C9|nr:response regulator [Acuticoccus sp. I52.16.1]UOM35746.1 response regulator [Acuticoccus sp. I52.16.1]